MWKPWNWLRSLWGLIGIPGDLQTLASLLTIVIPVGAGTGLWALFVYSGPAAIFLAVGVIAFGVVALNGISKRYRQNRLDDKLNISNIVLEQRINVSDGTKGYFQPLINVQSFAHFPTHYRVISTAYSFDGYPEVKIAETAEITNTVPPFSTSGYAVPPSIMDPMLKPARIAIKIEYGRERGKYTHKLETSMDLICPTFIPASQAGSHALLFTNQRFDVKRLSHDRN